MEVHETPDWVTVIWIIIVFFGAICSIANLIIMVVKQ